MKESLLSFNESAGKNAPDVLIALMQPLIVINGCSEEDHDGFFRATGYIWKHTENRNCHIHFSCV